MKKSKFLLGTLVLATALMGTGYAAWTDALTVKSTVSTGEFDMNFNGNGTLEQSDYVVAEQIVNKDSATITVSNLYPGAQVDFGINMDNDGTVPAKVASVVVDFGDETSKALMQNLEYDVAYRGEWVTGIKGTEDLSSRCTKFFREIPEEKKYVMPNTDAGIDIIIRVPNTLGEEIESQGGNLTFTVNYEQFNN